MAQEFGNGYPDRGTRRAGLPQGHTVTIRTPARWLLTLVAVGIVTWLLRRAGASLAPLLLGLLLAYLLLPIVSRLDRWLPRWASILTIYLVGLILLALALRYVVPIVTHQAGQFVQNLPTWIAQSEEFVADGIAAFQRTAPREVQEQVNRQVRQIQDLIERNATTYAQQVGAWLLNSIVTLLQTITFVVGFLVIPIFLFFVLLSAGKVPRAINHALHPAIRRDFWNLWQIVDRILGRYLRSQLILGVIVGVMTFLGLWTLQLLGIDVSYTVLLAIIAGIGELIPVIGPILSAVPAMLVVSGSGMQAVLAVVVLYIVIQQIESQILVPRIIGQTLRLNPALLLALIIIAAGAGGLPLMILSAPLTAIGRDVFIYLHRRLREPPLQPDAAIRGLLPVPPQATPKLRRISSARLAPGTRPSND